jgi:hypothetical protein
MAARTFSELFELARVRVRFDHVARSIVNPNHSIICTAVKVGSAPFPLLLPVILAPVCSRAYSGPGPPFLLTHKVKLTDRGAQTDAANT